MALLWRTRRYLADASAVELTRNPDALARALQRLSEDTTALAGGEWATHLFVVNPKGDRTLRGEDPSEDQKRKAMEAWAATAHLSSTPAAAPPQDYLAMRREMLATGLAFARGDQQAIARMQAMAQVMGGAQAMGLHAMPNPADIIAAQKGDRAAMARLHALRETNQPQRGGRRGQSGLQIQSMLSFHPSLKKRAKKLQRMGSHLIAPERKTGAVLVIFMTVLYLIIVPLLTVAAGLMLVVIAMMIGLNLMMLALWLTAIHWIFVWWNGR